MIVFIIKQNKNISFSKKLVLTFFRVLNMRNRNRKADVKNKRKYIIIMMNEKV